MTRATTRQKSPKNIWYKTSLFRMPFPHNLKLKFPLSVLMLAQFFAIMPIYGINTKSAKQLKFTWFNLRMLHSVIIMSGYIVMSILSIMWAALNPLSITALEPVVWFLSKFVVTINFWWLAKEWPNLMMEWERVEQNLPAYVGRKKNYFFFKEIKFYTIFITLLLIVEHTMSIAAGVFRGVVCTNKTSLEGYFKQAWPQVYSVNEYDGGWRAFLVEILNYYCTFLWTFMDTFIIAISICLSTRFKQLNNNLNRFKGMAMCKTFWTHQRLHFNAISGIASKVDDSISMITAFSLSSNLYYILIQLLHSFQPQGTVFETIYFWFSLVFLMGRTILVSLSAAKINEESKKPVMAIRAIPCESYNSEANRFLEEVTNSTIGLTGMRFFYLTRSLILSVAGTVVTYELVLVQFQILSPEKDHDNLCQRQIL